jgi:uncharacterized protein (TIGR04255 family)
MRAIEAEEDRGSGQQACHGTRFRDADPPTAARFAKSSPIVRVDPRRLDLPDPPYAQDTLRFVAAEVRFPVTEELGVQVPPALRERLRERFPIQEPLTQMTLTVGAAGPMAQQAIRQRFMPRDRLMSVTIGRDAVVLETTAYKTWTEFRDLFADVLTALAESQRPDGYLRLGVRYIDEIRVPEDIHKINTVVDWRGWVADALVEPFTIDDVAAPTNATLALQYGQYPGYQTVFKAAPFAAGRTVQDEGPLLLPFATPDGPYFLLDTDSSWMDPHRAVPEFDVDEMRERFDELHAPCKRLFERSLGSRLRSEVLDRPREEVWGE